MTLLLWLDFLIYESDIKFQMDEYEELEHITQNYYDKVYDNLTPSQRSRVFYVLCDYED